MAIAPVQPPIWNPPLSGRDAALVAGFILHYRAGILSGQEFFDLANIAPAESWGLGMREWWEHAEQVTRFLLWWTGYRVGKGEMWPQESMRDRP